MRVLSFGGGVQTVALLLLQLRGDLPRADHVVFADTGCEIPETYAYIEQVVRPLCQGAGLPFEVVRASGSYGAGMYDYYWRYRLIPMPWSRSCTHKFKIRPIYRFARGLEVNLALALQSPRGAP